MTMTPGSWSERTLSPGKMISVLVAEIKLHMFAFVLIAIGVEFTLMVNGKNVGVSGGVVAQEVSAFSRDGFCIGVIVIFALFSCLEYVFRFFVKSRLTSLISVIPAALIIFLVKDIEFLPYLQAMVGVALIARVIICFLVSDLVLLYGSFVLDIIVFVLHFFTDSFSENTLTDRFLFISLVILTLSSLQQFFYEKLSFSFPFHYFVVLGILISFIPMKSEPIDWTPVVEAGTRIVYGFVDMADEVSYKLSLSFGKNKYSAGYSSFRVTGDSYSDTDKTQILLKSEDKPYFVFADEENGGNLKVRRVAYLAGGRGKDDSNIVNFLNLLYKNEADKEYAALFSRISKLNLQYVYLDTRDEIVPINSLSLYADEKGSGKGKEITAGVSDKRHHKGYKINARYLEIDYGSPYYVELVRSAGESNNQETLSYADACNYMRSLYGIGLEEFMTETSYNKTIASISESNLELQKTSATSQTNMGQYLDTSGATNRMSELAESILGEALKSSIKSDGDTSVIISVSDYDKCKMVEAYLRQYVYNEKALGGKDPSSDLSSAQGMADIADRFLFETQSGYCVHFTSAMVMLLRLNGIPARVSVGFRYAFPFEAQENYEVSSSLAHAWPEAYIEGVGWIPFEPTSGYLTAEDFTWHRKEKNLEIEEQSYENLQIPKSEVKSEEIDPEESENAIEKEIAPQLISIGAKVALSVAGILLILIIGAFLLKKLRYKYGTPTQKLKMDVESIKRIIHKKSNEDFEDRGLLSDYEERVPEDIRAEVASVFAIYYRSIYGKKEEEGITPEENERAHSVKMRLESCFSK